MRDLRLSSLLDGAHVELPPAARQNPMLLADVCACCAAPATHRSPLRLNAGAELGVGYCDACAEHQGSHAARGLALSLSSLLLGLVAAAGLPLLMPWLGLGGLVLAVTAMASVPLLALFLPRARLCAPHTARGPALFWGALGELQCAAPQYAERLAELNGGVWRRAVIRERRASAWASAGPVVAVGAACLSFFVYHPLLRILNLGTTRVEVALDGQLIASVEPTSNESPTAGALVRVPAGEHRLTVTSAIDGAALAQVPARLQSGAVHLFAFAAEQTCFWLETTGYGREQRAATSVSALAGAGPLWVLPNGIDTFFAPNPESSLVNARSSGGLLTALRQAPCAEAPPEVSAARQFESPGAGLGASP